MIPILEPIFQDPLAEFANALVLSPVPPAGAIPATRLTDGFPVLGNVLQRYAARLHHDGKDLRPVASAWSMAYIGALLAPVCAAATVLQQVFPIAIDQIFVNWPMTVHRSCSTSRQLVRPYPVAEQQSATRH